MDMLSGSLVDKILKFALPLAITGILQQLFNAADIAVVGQFVGKNAMAAVGSNSPVISLIVTLFLGISLGANVVIANLTGQGDRERVNKAVHTAIIVALLSGVFGAVLGEIFAVLILKTMSVPEEILDMAVLYLRIYMAGLPVVLLYNFESAIFRSQGDTATPLICLVISGLINVGLNLFFVCVMKMTVSGVALATMISNLISSLMLFYFLKTRDSIVKLSLKSLKIDPKLLLWILKIGIPAGVQGMVFSISNVIVQSAINSLGADVMAASSAAFNVEIFVYFIINSFGQACTTFVGQNYGAGQLKRCVRITRLCLLLDAGATAVISGLLFLTGKQLLGIFNGDPVIIEYGYIRITFILAAELINVVMEVLSGCMRGYNYSTLPAIMTFVGVSGVRIVWVYTIFASHRDFRVLMGAYPASWFAAAAALTAAYFYVKRQVFKKQEEMRNS